MPAETSGEKRQGRNRWSYLLAGGALLLSACLGDRQPGANEPTTTAPTVPQTAEANSPGSSPSLEVLGEVGSYLEWQLQEYPVVMSLEEFFARLPQELEIMAADDLGQTSFTLPFNLGTRHTLRDPDGGQGAKVITPMMVLRTSIEPSDRFPRTRELTATDDNPQGFTVFGAEIFHLDQFNLSTDDVEYWFVDHDGNVRSFTSADIASTQPSQSSLGLDTFQIWRTGEGHGQQSDRPFTDPFDFGLQLNINGQGFRVIELDDKCRPAATLDPDPQLEEFVNQHSCDIASQ